MAERFRKKRAFGRARDEEEPRPDHRQKQRQAPKRPQLQKPARVAVGRDEAQRRQQRHQRRHRPLDQGRGGQRRPEQQRPGPRRGVFPGPARLAVNPAERQLRRRYQPEQRGVGLGEMRFRDQRQRSRQQRRAQERGGISHQMAPEREGQKNRGDRAEERRQAVGPDGALFGAAQGRHRQRLEPIDSGGLAVARLVLEADAEIIAALDHLARRLGEARLVAVGHRQRVHSGQVKAEAQQSQERVRPPALSRPGRKRARDRAARCRHFAGHYAQTAATSRMTISPACSIAPSTSPV